MIEIRRTDTFVEWLDRQDADVKAKVVVRLFRVEQGNLGDVKSVGGKVSELRIDHGPGYRLYFTWRGRTLIILLCGGDKRTQVKDIRRAQAMVDELE